jgi:hypothetical protein
MKVLKSGIEMKRSQLRKIRGGACGCGCGIGYSSTNMSVVGEDGHDCYCGCTSQDEPWGGYHGMWIGAAERI